VAVTEALRNPKKDVAFADAIARATSDVRRRSRPSPSEPVSRLEAQNVGDRDTIQMTTDSPGGKDFRVDELVDRFAAELPPAAQLRHCQPGGTRIRRD